MDINLNDGTNTYHFNVIYNKAVSPQSKTPDTELSLKFTLKLITKCSERGFSKCYYHGRDARPGKNIFFEHTRVINESKFTIVVLTRDFVRDCYAKYRHHTALKILLDSRRADKLIPIAVGLSGGEIPEELGIFEPLQFLPDCNSWETQDSQVLWTQLLSRLEENETELYPRGNYIAQERGDNLLRTELNDGIVTETTPSLDNSRESLMSDRQMEEPQIATIELHPGTTEPSSQRSMSLDVSPSIRPPALVSPPNQSVDRPTSNQASSLGTAIPDNVNRQQSLSMDADLATDHSPPHVGPVSCTPVVTDSGCDLGATGSSSSIADYSNMSSCSDTSLATGGTFESPSDLTQNDNNGTTNVSFVTNEISQYVGNFPNESNPLGTDDHTALINDKKNERTTEKKVANDLMDASVSNITFTRPSNNPTNVGIVEPMMQSSNNGLSTQTDETYRKWSYHSEHASNTRDDSLHADQGELTNEEQVEEVFVQRSTGVTASRPELSMMGNTNAPTSMANLTASSTNTPNLVENLPADSSPTQNNEEILISDDRIGTSSGAAHGGDGSLFKSIFMAMLSSVAKPECAYKGWPS